MLKHLKIKSYKGFTLVEILVAVAILGICAVGLFTVLTFSTKLLLNTNLEETSRNFATAQMEYVKNLPYDNTDPMYLPSSDLSSKYPNLNVDIDSESVHPIGSTETDDEGVQKITITITQGGKTLTTLEGFKADWCVK